MKNFMILICLTCNVVLSQDTLEGKKNEITKYLEEIKNDYNVPGMVVVISNKNGIEYLRSFGNVSTDNNFIIGSNSKAFTALIILRLQEKGLLNINDPVVKYLQWFEYENKEVSNKVTIKNLLNHTSGQTTEIGNVFFDEYENAENVRLKITELLKSIKVDYYPIQEFEYSNTNYQLLGYIIENVTEKEYSKVFKEEISDLIKLENTGAILPENLAQGYQPFLYYPIIPITPNYNKVDIPVGFINSNAYDLSKYLCEIMNSYNNDTTSVVSKNITNELFNPNKENNAHYALGWFNIDYKDTETITHDGLVESFNSAFVIAPEIEKNIIVLTNNYGESAGTTSLGVLSILLDKDPTRASKAWYYIIRSLPFLVLILLLIFIIGLKKWVKKGMPMGISRKLLPNILLSIGIIIAYGWTFYLPSIFGASIKNVFQYDITSGFSAVLLTILTLGISCVLYFNKLKKPLPNNGYK